MSKKTQKVKISDINLDGYTQVRVKGLNKARVKEYAEDMKKGDKFPPCTLMFDGNTYWVIGGYHRIAARKKNRKKSVEAEVTEGTKEEALLAALSENATHGGRRTNADKRNAVKIALEDPKWSKWNDSELARVCKVSRPFIAKIRKQLSCKRLHDSETDKKSGNPDTAKKRKVQRAGKTYLQKVKKGDPGKNSPSQLTREEKLTKTYGLWGIKEGNLEQLLTAISGNLSCKRLHDRNETKIEKPEEKQPTPDSGPLSKSAKIDTSGTPLGSLSMDAIRSLQVKPEDMGKKTPRKDPDQEDSPKLPTNGWLSDTYTPIEDENETEDEYDWEDDLEL